MLRIKIGYFYNPVNIKLTQTFMSQFSSENDLRPLEKLACKIWVGCLFLFITAKKTIDQFKSC